MDGEYDVNDEIAITAAGIGANMTTDREKAVQRVQARSFSSGDYSCEELAASAQSHLLEAFGYLTLLKSSPGIDCDPYAAEDALTLTDDAVTEITFFLKEMNDARERDRNEVYSRWAA